MTALAAVGGNGEAGLGLKASFFLRGLKRRCTANRGLKQQQQVSDHCDNKRKQNRTCLKSERSGKNTFLEQHKRRLR